MQFSYIYIQVPLVLKHENYIVEKQSYKYKKVAVLVFQGLIFRHQMQHKVSALMNENNTLLPEKIKAESFQITEE